MATHAFTIQLYDWMAESWISNLLMLAIFFKYQVLINIKAHQPIQRKLLIWNQWCKHFYKYTNNNKATMTWVWPPQWTWKWQDLHKNWFNDYNDSIKCFYLSTRQNAMTRNEKILPLGSRTSFKATYYDTRFCKDKKHKCYMLQQSSNLGPWYHTRVIQGMHHLHTMVPGTEYRYLLQCTVLLQQKLYTSYYELWEALQFNQKQQNNEAIYDEASLWSMTYPQQQDMLLRFYNTAYSTDYWQKAFLHI